MPGDVPGYAQTYLEVQALSPLGEGTAPASAKSPSLEDLSLENLLVPVIIFASVIFIGLVAFLASKLKTSSYLSNSIKLALIIAIIPISLSLISYQTRLSSKAGPEHTPKNLVVSNVTSSQFTAQWLTQAPALSGIRVSLSPTFSTIFYTSSSNPNSPATSHHFIVTQLSPQTTYYLQIFSEGKWYDNQGQPLVITTKP